MVKRSRKQAKRPTASLERLSTAQPPESGTSAPRFDPSAARSVLATVRTIDLTVASVDEIKRLLESVFTGLPVRGPKFDPGVLLFSGRLGPKPAKISDLTITSRRGPPRKARVQVLPCSTSREGAVFTLKPQVGDTVSIIHWRTAAPLSLGGIGYTRHLFDTLNASRAVPEWAEIPEELGGFPLAETLGFLADLFGRGVATERMEIRDKLIAATSEFLLTTPLIEGFMIPSAFMRANADDVFLKKDFADAHLQFLKAEHFRITAMQDFSYITQTIDSAPEIARGGVIEWYATAPDAATGMPKRYGTVGWQEFLAQKRDMLRGLDSARQRNANRPIQTEHGAVAEAILRQWLEESLPKKYGVTSGFVIPDMRSMGYVVRHYDVIIYDAASAPVLWVENNPDKSERGRSRAIPAEYVRAVFEVKARFTERSIKDALSKLGELDGCRLQLPTGFVSTVIFFEVGDKEQVSCALAEQLFRPGIPGYFGGLILRANGLDPNLTGYFEFSEEPKETVAAMPLVRNVSMMGRNEQGGITLPAQGDTALAVSFDGVWNFDIGYTPVVKQVRLLWAYNSFPWFFFDLLARLEGKWKPPRETQRGGYGLSFVR